MMLIFVAIFIFNDLLEKYNRLVERQDSNGVKEDNNTSIENYMH